MNKVYICTKIYNLKDFKLRENYIFLIEDHFFKEALKFEPEDIFISFDHKTPLEFRLEYYTIPSESLVIIGEDLNIAKLLDKSNLKEHYMNDYPVFSGGVIKSHKKDIKDGVYNVIKFLANIMYPMLEAGYLEMKNYKKIDDWIISFEHPILKIFKIYHKIETSNPSLDFEEEFLINPQFRQMILIMIMKILANYIINNNITTEDKIVKKGTWKDIEVWKSLKKKLID